MNAFRPGCYGSFVMFNSVPTVCNSCAYKDECRVEAKSNGQKLRSKIKALNESVVPVQAQTSSYKLISDAISLDGLPVKAKPIAITLSKRLKEIKQALKDGVEVEGKPEFMTTAINQLNKGFTKKDLKMTFMDKLSWSEGTAASHVSMAVAVLEALGLAKADNEGVIRTKQS